MTNLIVYLMALLVAVLVIVFVYGAAGAVFALLWNFLMPALWHAAPHLSWKAGVAVAWIIGVLQALFGRTAKS